MSPSGEGERLVARGQKGDKGDQGDAGQRGQAGLSRAVRRTLVFLFVLNVVLAAANLLWTEHVVMTGNQQRCASIVADATIPLPHPIAGNPSREWEAAFEAIQRHRAHQLGCV